jgi:hypothetical protein
MWKNIRKNYLYSCYKTQTRRRIGEKILSTKRTIVAPDGTTFEDKLNEIYTKRTTLAKNKINVVANKILQPLLSQDKIFGLEKYDNCYYTRRLTDLKLFHADEYYIFVIPFDTPYKILCAQLIPGVSRKDQRQQLEGHTSFTGDKPVYYAGIVRFNNGKLIFWNNASGHFRPSATAHYNFLPHIQRLLPSNLFYANEPFSFTI